MALKLSDIAKAGRASDVETARFAVRDAISETAHLTGLRAYSAGIDDAVDAIVLALANPAVAWAIEGIINELRADASRKNALVDRWCSKCNWRGQGKHGDACPECGADQCVCKHCHPEASPPGNTP